MRTILLAAGYGTRLRPLTNTIPKCLVPIHGQPLLEIWLQQLSYYGFISFLINTHYLAAHVEIFVQNSTYKEQVTLSYEPELLGTAGTLLANLDFFQEDDGLLIHADNYCLANFQEFIEAHKHRPPGCLITMMTFRTETPSTCGIVEIDGRGVVIGFHEKVSSPPGNLANGAIYLISRELQEKLPVDFSQAQDFSKDVVPQLLGKIYTYETQETFIDIGTLEAYQKANS